MAELAVFFGAEDGGRICLHAGEQPPYTRTPWGQDRIELVNRSTAEDPTWAELTSFLKTDNTDSNIYDALLFPCGAFAEQLHNNAEASGIRSAFVVLRFDENMPSHALNAFNTSDKGPVLIDATNFYAVNPNSPDASVRDKVAYVNTGKRYGLISLEFAQGPAYSDYEAYVTRRGQYQLAVDGYYEEAISYLSLMEQDACGDEPESLPRHEQLEIQAAKLGQINEDLKEEGRSLGPFWESYGTVSGIEIYW